MIEKNSLADINNRYAIISAATESGINQEDPNWKNLTDKEKWAAIKDLNLSNQMEASVKDRMSRFPDIVATLGLKVKTQGKIISDILKERSPISAEAKKEEKPALYMKKCTKQETSGFGESVFYNVCNCGKKIHASANESFAWNLCSEDRLKFLNENK
jgi:acyl-CoA-binding protein